MASMLVADYILDRLRQWDVKHVFGSGDGINGIVGAFGRSGSLSGTLATMGPAVPYAIGAKFGCPERPAIALAGDGAMQMNGLAELITIKRYWEQWADPRLIVAVLRNDDLNQVTWELRAMGGSPKFTESQMLPDISYSGFAESIGLQGIYVDDPSQIGEAWERALSANRPTVLDVRVDPDVPPIPPHATFAQAKQSRRRSSCPDGRSRRERPWRISVLEPRTPHPSSCTSRTMERASPSS